MEEIKETKESPREKWKLPFFQGKKGKRRLQIAVVLIVVACIAVGCVAGTRKKLNTQLGGSYLVDQAVRQDLSITVSESATLAPADSYHVTTLISGEIESAPFEEWDMVEKGTPLYTLESTDAQSSVDRAGLSVQQAQVNYDQAKQAMHPTAPITGTIREVLVHNGDSVNPGTPLATITASMDLSIDFMFPYAQPEEFWVGQTATIFFDGVAGTTEGKVTAVSDSATVTSAGTQGCSVRVTLKNPGIISDSMTASATIGSNISYGHAAVNLPYSATAYASASGTVTGLDKLAGSSVKAGEVLCTVDSESARNQAENARLSLESARLSAQSSTHALDDYHITSPIAGTVIEKNYKAGDKVEGSASGDLAVIFDLSYLKLEMNVHELDIGKVKTGQKVEITADALEGQMFTGVVDKVGINGTQSGGATSYPVTVILEDYGELRPGMTVSATILGDQMNDVLCIPVSAVSRGNTVLVPGPGAMSEDGTKVVDPTKVESREVRLGRSNELYIEVLEGLSEGDTVLTENQASSMMEMMMGG